MATERIDLTHLTAAEIVPGQFWQIVPSSGSPTHEFPKVEVRDVILASGAPKEDVAEVALDCWKTAAFAGELLGSWGTLE